MNISLACSQEKGDMQLPAQDRTDTYDNAGFTEVIVQILNIRDTNFYIM